MRQINWGFNQLKVLSNEKERYTVVKLQFQKLKYLVLKSCDELAVVPIKLADVASLQNTTSENAKKEIKFTIPHRKQEMHCKKQL